MASTSTATATPISSSRTTKDPRGSSERPSQQDEVAHDPAARRRAQYQAPARVHLVSGGATQMREIHAGSNYVSADPAEAHFGLGTARVADELRVAWPDGSETVLPAVQAGGALSIAKLPDGAPSCAEGGESKGCSPGGRIDSKAECLLEWHVTPTPPPGKDGPPSGSLVCTDGDPACDADEGVDHECAFRVAVCINNRDPRLAACAPSDVASLVVRAPGPRAARLGRAPSVKRSRSSPARAREVSASSPARRSRTPHPTTARRRARSGFHSASAGTAPSRRAWSSSSSSRRHATGGETRTPSAWSVCRRAEAPRESREGGETRMSFGLAQRPFARGLAPKCWHGGKRKSH